MQCNQAGIDLIKEFESCKLKSYQDVRGIWTCGWGATGPDIDSLTEWTQEQADARFLSDLDTFNRGVTKLVTSPVGPNQFSAMVSFAYNLGLGTLKVSTLLKCVNKLRFIDAANEILKWNHSSGIVVEGLTRRRKAEQELFLRDITYS